jgi:Family of unknown function (DUF6788)
MTPSRAGLWQKLIELSPLCSGSLHEQYLRCGKPACRCHAAQHPQLHGPYYLWVRRIGGKQVNRTLRPGADLERVKGAMANYRQFQELFGQLLEQEETAVLGVERAVTVKKNSRRRWRKRSGR